MRFKVHIILLLLLFSEVAPAQQPVKQKPRVLISTDIGGTDPDDNQSMTHLLMYSDRFKLEGLVSSPSYGNGSKEEIFRMIELYEKDLPRLKRHGRGFAEPAFLRSITKQGRRGQAPYSGFTTATEGSDWIISCARRKSAQPLWILGWGGLEDIAQALHDAPDIASRIRVYWIGGPNKKWSANSYAYIAKNFPQLWIIENNSSYYGLFSNSSILDSVNTTGFYDAFIGSKSNLGRDFKNYYKGEVKMGDTPSLLYMMDGDYNKPGRESWGGSFEPTSFSSHVAYDRLTTIADSVAFCTVVEFRFRGPQLSIAADSSCFFMETIYKNNVQRWPGYYLGNGIYGLQYVPKQAEVLQYRFTSLVAGAPTGEGKLTVTNLWPGKKGSEDFPLGLNWYTDRSDPMMYDGKIQGGKTVSRWRTAVLMDWAKRWAWLNKQ